MTGRVMLPRDPEGGAPSADTPAPAVRGAHTPGPWVVVYHAPGHAPSRVHIGSPSVGHTIIDTEYPGRWTMSEADAHLIAAAPELLDALEGLVTVWTSQGPCFCHDYEEFSQDGDGWHSERCRKARAAIARAHGEGR